MGHPEEMNGKSMDFKTYIAPPAQSTTPITLPHKLLMGPGPTSPHPRVLAAASMPMVGPGCPEFAAVTGEVNRWLKYVFQTESNFCVCVSGSGHAAMEATVAALVEPGDKVICGVNGLWGERLAMIAETYGGEVVRMHKAVGGVFTLEEVEAALVANPGTAVVFLVHGESTTGALQPLEGMGALCHKHGALLSVDNVVTLGGVPFYMDKWEVDAAHSGSQKCLGSLVGPSPVCLNKGAQEKMDNRKTPIRSYYLNLALIGGMWQIDGRPQSFHQTSLISNMLSLREALALLTEEGLEHVWARHQEAAAALVSGLERMGLELFVPDPKRRLATVTTVRVPKGIEAEEVVKGMMQKHSIQIYGGLGVTRGKVLRMGLLAHGARLKNVALLLWSLEDVLMELGWKGPAVAPLEDDGAAA